MDQADKRIEHALSEQVASAGVRDEPDELRALGHRVVATFDRLRQDLELWSRLDDTEEPALREILDPVGGTLAAIVEMVGDYLDEDVCPISTHRLEGLRYLVNAPSVWPATSICLSSSRSDDDK